MLARRYGWGPDVVWRLTLAEVLCYLHVDDDESAPALDSLADEPRQYRAWTTPSREAVSTHDVQTALNARRARDGRAPLEVRVLGG